MKDQVQSLTVALDHVTGGDHVTRTSIAKNPKKPKQYISHGAKKLMEHSRVSKFIAYIYRNTNSQIIYSGI